MKNILKLGLAALAIASLAACGGGGSSDAADTYVGTWKSNCYAYTASSGATYYAVDTDIFTKTSAAELAVNGTYNAHTDAACTNVLGTQSNSTIKINIGAKTSFLGGSVDAMVYTLVSTGEARPGYIVADGTKMNLVVVGNNGAQPTTWSLTSPYTKQ